MRAVSVAVTVASWLYQLSMIGNQQKRGRRESQHWLDEIRDNILSKWINSYQAGNRHCTGCELAYIQPILVYRFSPGYAIVNGCKRGAGYFQSGGWVCSSSSAIPQCWGYRGLIESISAKYRIPGQLPDHGHGHNAPQGC